MAKNCLRKISSKVHSFFEKIFNRWGLIVFDYPWIVLGITVLLIPLFIFGWINHEINENGEEIWVPDGAKSIEDQNKIEDIFGDLPTSEQVYIKAKDENKGLLTKEAFAEILEYQQRFMDEIEIDGKKFSDICTKSENSICYLPNNPLLFFEIGDGEYDLDRVSNDSELVDLIETGKGQPELFSADSQVFIDIETMFGGTNPEKLATNEDGTNDIEYAIAAKWFYSIDGSLDFQDLFDYESDWEDFSDDFNDSSEHIEVFLYLRYSIDRGNRDVTADDLLLILAGIAVLILWCFMTMFRENTVKSRTFIAGMGVLSVVIAYIGSLAIGTAVGIEGTIVTSVLPFFLLGIGVDDMYVLLFYLEEAGPELTGREKMSFMMRNAGLSITITSLTNCISFSMGSISTMYAIRSFCFFAVFGLLLDYIYEITFFASILALDIRRSEKEYGDCWGLCFCKPTSAICCKGKFIYDTDGNEKISTSKKVIRDYYAPTIVNKYVKIAVLVIFTAFIGVNIYGASELEVKFFVEDFVLDDYYVTGAIDIRDDYFDINVVKTGAYSLESEFANESIQNEIIELENSLEDCEGCDKNVIVNGSINSWYEFLRDFVNSEDCSVNGSTVSLQNSVIPEESFYECLDQWLETDLGAKYVENIVFNDENTELIGSVIYFDMEWKEDLEVRIEAVDDIRDLAEDEGPDDTYAFTNRFKWVDHQSYLANETIVSVSLSLTSIIVIVVLLIADLQAALIIISIPVTVLVSLLALIYFWELNLNTVTVVNIIISVGIAVDYSAHIVQVFCSVRGTKNERVEKSLNEISLSVLNAGISTFICILCMTPARSFVFSRFWKCWFGIILYSLVFSVVLLPVILSLIGPAEHLELEDSPSEHYAEVKKEESPNNEEEQRGSDQDSSKVLPDHNKPEPQEISENELNRC